MSSTATLLNESIVYLIDDDLEICKAIKWLFQSVGLTVEIFNSPVEFLKNFSADLQGCILLDIRMPEMSGLELLTELNKKNNTMHVIIITGHGDIPMAVRAMKMGAVDFLSKPIDDKYLIDQVQSLISIKRSTSNESPSVEIGGRLDMLTSRELQILELVVNGRMNKQISHDLKISVSTVEFHRSRIMKKMGVKTLGQLIMAYFCS